MRQIRKQKRKEKLYFRFFIFSIFFLCRRNGKSHLVHWRFRRGCHGIWIALTLAMSRERISSVMSHALSLAETLLEIVSANQAMLMQKAHSINHSVAVSSSFTMKSRFFVCFSYCNGNERKTSIELHRSTATSMKLSTRYEINQMTSFVDLLRSWGKSNRIFRLPTISIFQFFLGFYLQSSIKTSSFENGFDVLRLNILENFRCDTCWQKPCR